MNQSLDALVDEIKELEKLVADKLQQTKSKLTFELNQGRTVFLPKVRKRHRAIARRAWRTLWESSFLTVLTAPMIYSLFVPLTMLDHFISIDQRVCFPVYGIPRVVRDEYVVIDRHMLSYLNVIEKLNCVYCGYGNGVLTYAREIAARTEQYWCPIKHARMNKGVHNRQCLYCDFGDADAFLRDYAKLRTRFGDTRSDVESSLKP